MFSWLLIKNLKQDYYLFIYLLFIYFLRENRSLPQNVIQVLFPFIQWFCNHFPKPSCFQTSTKSKLE